jgi:CRISPR-associated protein Cmr6
MEKFYYLPQDTSDILYKFPRERIENFALLLNKLVQFRRKKSGQLEVIKKLEELSDKNKYEVWIKKFQKITKQFVKKYQNFVEKIAKDSLTLTLSWRLTIGLGSASVYETSITLHHIYGIPYLPGSAIKGVTRSYKILCMAEELSHPDDYYERVALLEKFLEKFDLVKEFPEWKKVKNFQVNNPEDKNKKIKFSEQLYKSLEAKQAELRIFQLIFGTQERQGCIIFFDSFPENFEIKYDIMNPHYGPYYTERGGKPPADYYNPVPIPFLVLENAKFTFYLGVKSRLVSAGEKEDLLKIAKKWLKEALTNYGIGAKTTLGYGIFE